MIVIDRLPELARAFGADHVLSAAELATAGRRVASWALGQSLAFLRPNLRRFLFERVISHVLPLERISETFRRADWMQRQGDPLGISRAAISM